MQAILYIALSYLVGAIPFGFLAGKLNGIDLREHGSGNIGATNVLRLLGKSWGIGVFILDFAKGWLPAFGWIHLIAPRCFDPASPQGAWWTAAGLVLTCLATVLGHTYTCFLRFKGGKGVATTAGVLFALSPLMALISVAGWVGVLLMTRYVSVASMAAGLFMIAAAMYDFGFFEPQGLTWRPEILIILFLAVVAALVIWKHRSNIARIREGVEPRVFERKHSS